MHVKDVRSETVSDVKLCETSFKDRCESDKHHNKLKATDGDHGYASVWLVPSPSGAIMIATGLPDTGTISGELSIR